MATGNVSPRQGKIIDIPANAPTIGTAVDATTGGAASVPFTAGSTATGGPISSYRAVSNPGSITGTGTSSPITVSGLTNGTTYTFTVAAVNPSGTGPFSSASNSATPTVPPTAYESIATTTSGGTSITLSSIPSGYKHLQIRVNFAKTTGDRYMAMRMNSDTGNNYSYVGLQGESSVSRAVSNTPFSYIGEIGYCYNGPTHRAYAIIDILNYGNTNMWKTTRTLSGAASTATSLVGYHGGLWKSTAAVTSLTFTLVGDTFSSDTTIALYGIKGA